MIPYLKMKDSQALWPAGGGQGDDLMMSEARHSRIITFAGKMKYAAHAHEKPSRVQGPCTWMFHINPPQIHWSLLCWGRSSTRNSCHACVHVVCMSCEFRVKWAKPLQGDAHTALVPSVTVCAPFLFPFINFGSETPLSLQLSLQLLSSAPR